LPHLYSWTSRLLLSKEKLMRGPDEKADWMFSYVSAEKRVPKDHPLRAIRTMVDVVLNDLSPLFETLYARRGRPSVAPEKLLRALLLQVLYSVRSERMLMEELDYNLLFRWFVGLSMDDQIWDPTVFSKNRDRLLEGEIARAFFERVICHARAQGLLSDEHFTVDGTLIEAWAGQKSFKRKGTGGDKPTDDPGNPTVDFKGEKRSNATHESTTDPDALCLVKTPSAGFLRFFGDSAPGFPVSEECETNSRARSANRRCFLSEWNRTVALEVM
jgi:transposase